MCTGDVYFDKDILFLNKLRVLKFRKVKYYRFYMVLLQIVNKKQNTGICQKLLLIISGILKGGTLFLLDLTKNLYIYVLRLNEIDDIFYRITKPFTLCFDYGQF